MKTKILVHGKSQSRTALGIINAYLKLYPDATPSEVQRAFPKWLNHRCVLENLIIPVKKTLGYEKMFFEHEDELIVFDTGEMYALVEVWDKDDFNAICEHAKQYGIEVAKVGTRPFEKGSFKLEYLDGRKKKCRFRWLWLLLLLVLLLLLMIFCCRKCCHNNTHQNPDKSAIVPIVLPPKNDRTLPTPSTNNSPGVTLSIPLPDGNVLNIAKNTSEYRLFSFLNNPDIQVDVDKTKGWIPMDNIHFKTGKAVLLPESEDQLKNIALMMRIFPNTHIKIGGYTDDTGSDEANMKLSAQRAKATFEKLVLLGVAENRMAHEGYGSNYPVSADDNAANRRVDIRVTQK